MDEAYVGEVRALPYEFVPRGWAACQGQLLQVSSNPALFSLIGNLYGGDGKTTFALPDIAPLAGKEGTLEYCIAVVGRYPPR